MPLILRPKTLRFAVTGLSGSGKTAFITSIIENLIAAAAQPVRLPFLRAASERRLVEVRPTRRQPAAGVPFPLLETVAALGADPPRWPGGTTELRRVDLSVLFHPSGLFGIANPPGRFANRVAEVTIEITDYPGEWLLDLPLLGQTFQHWSRMTMELAAQGVRAPLARDWLAFLDRHPPYSRSDAQTAQQAYDLYRTYLVVCRRRERLSLLQPGRFLNPGQAADGSYLPFCPMPAAGGAKPLPGSLAAVMETRFEAYKRDVVRPFFTRLARGIDRQIVLVDVFHALNAGEEAFTDQRKSLEIILNSFRFGRRGLLRRLFGARIDRVLFAATKADHVPALQRDHLEALMSNMMATPSLSVERARSRAAVAAIASIRCTEDGADEIDGRKVDVVIGLPQGGDRRIHFFPGIVPVTPPPTGFWGERFTEIPLFQPPRLQHRDPQGIPHINLDKALDFLLGDVLA
ncbi:MAG TPA: YcjX family protein [Stellaceae bacterium]|nr:YcjX family protein [Stellaceae bacterium]